MNDQSVIISAFESLCAEGKAAALATVVAVSGSAYRRPGARMLIAEDGRTWGGVSGGCLERDVVRRSRGVLASGRPVTCRYETTDDEDLASGVATGCRGTVDLFIEPLSSEARGPIPWMVRASRERRAVVLATVVRTSAGSLADRPGARLAIEENGAVVGHLNDSDLRRFCMNVLSNGSVAPFSRDPAFTPSPGTPGEGWGEGPALSSEEKALTPGLSRSQHEPSVHFRSMKDTNHEHASACHPERSEGSLHPPTEEILRCAQDDGLKPSIPFQSSTGRGSDDSTWQNRTDLPKLIAHHGDGATTELFIERLLPPQELVIFGSGPDVAPVVSIAKLMGWRVTVVGVRPATGLAQRFAHADELHVTPAEVPLAGVEIRRDSAVVLMTHNFPRDIGILAGLSTAPRYLGILGPRARTEQLFSTLNNQNRPGPPDFVGSALRTICCGVGNLVRSADPTQITPSDSGEESAEWRSVFAPIGLDLGAETPAEIALSIVAEIQAVLRSTPAGSLRERDGPIHAVQDAEQRRPHPIESQRVWREVACPT